MRRVLIGFLLTAVLALALMMFIWAQHRIPQQMIQPRSRITKSVDFNSLFSGITAERLQNRHARIVRPPSRLAGSAAQAEISRYIEQEFRRLQMDVLVQTFPVTVPITKRCEAVYENGERINGISLAPFWPNLVRTCTTPPRGLAGKVVDVGSGALENLDVKQISGNIALVTMTRGLDWLNAAKFGATAILMRRSEDPTRYAKKVLHLPANMPRFFIQGDADQLVGKQVRIRARVDWENREARNVFGILRPKQPSDETIVLLGYSDSWSVVPDIAPGHYEACSIVSLLEIAEQLAAQRDGLARNVIFVALSGRCMAAEGSRRLCDALAGRRLFADNLKLLQDRRRASDKRVAAIMSALDAYSPGQYWNLDATAESALWNGQNPEAKKTFTSVLSGLIDRYVETTTAQWEDSRVAWVQNDRPREGPLFEAQLAAASRNRRAQSAVAAEPVSLKQHFRDVLDASGCRDQLQEALVNTLDQAKTNRRVHADALRVAKLFEPFEKIYLFFLMPSASGQMLSYRGENSLCLLLESARDAVLKTWLQWRGRPARDPNVYKSYLFNQNKNHIRPHRVKPRGTGHGFDITTDVYRQTNRAFFLFAGMDHPAAFQTPLVTQVDFDDLAGQTQILGALAAQVGSGVEPMEHPGKMTSTTERMSDFGGQVMGHGGPNTLLPDRPVTNSLVVLQGWHGKELYIQKSLDGSFRFPAVEAYEADWLFCDAYTLDRRTGQITGARDMGTEGQRFPNRLHKGQVLKNLETRVTILLTRVSPTDMYRLLSPDGAPLAARLLDARFRSPPVTYSISEYWEEGTTVFVQPGERFYVILRDMSGHLLSRGGPVVRGALLGHSLTDANATATDFWGPGYMAGRDYRIAFQESDAAVSLALANRVHLDRQAQRGLADPVNWQLAKTADNLLQRSREAFKTGRAADALRDANASLGVSARVYPAVKRAVADAVSGILLYMFLLVPFSVFAERLLVGANDIRARLAGTLLIFIAVFLLIRMTHPAYGLLKSAMIVLVGFVIFMLCLLILGFLFSRFSQRISILRHSGSTGNGATDVSRASAAGAAFSLGINNMRKRKVRTGYTIATLVLISFSLVCFTSPQPQLTERELAMGPASFSGILHRKTAHLSAAKARFPNDATIVARKKKDLTHSSPIYFATPDHGFRVTDARGILWIQTEEADVSHLDRILLPGGRWFEQNHQSICYLSQTVAADLGIDPKNIANRQVEVWFEGRHRQVLGIFDSTAFGALRDIDGERLLPQVRGSTAAMKRQQQRTMSSIGRPGSKTASASYLPAEKVVLMPLDPEATEEYDSTVIVFENLPYGTMRQTIDHLKDSTPMFLSYALDGMAFFGGRLRGLSLEGLADIMVPLLVASLIVLNTMLGSVYERQKEISVYSAVGLSPRHVFYLFLAESLVFGVVGVVGGYLAALGLQWLSHHTGDLLALKIDYSSRAAIYVCVTLIVTVVISSLAPAFRAARLAAPSDRLMWNMPPESSPGRLNFDLPFTFVGPDILAAVPFLTSWLDAHGDESSGAFFASEPGIEVRWQAKLPVLSVTSTTWLRPSDLGVSQGVRLSLRPSEEMDMYVAGVEINRLTGSLRSWRRANTRFVGALRRHLLSWRAVPTNRKHTLFEHGARIIAARKQ